ncbi:MAG TPA: RHS repeat-associated core domain-containing protein [Candidatus Acidoferrum sp.]|nr:RHS repeat-associated core domain-containing protein [Candidatus Acidoferrum sp.]
MIRLTRILSLLSFLALAAVQLHAQVTTGTPPFSSSAGGPDVIDLANLNAHVTIPVLHKAGRGTNFTYDLSYDSSVWYPITSGSTTSWQPLTNWGWRGQTEAATGYVSFNATVTFCYTGRIPTGSRATTTGWVFHDAWGVPHSFSGSTYSSGGTCGTNTRNFTSTTADGSGYVLVTNVPNVPSATVYTSKGMAALPPANATSGSASGTDRNGNQITVNSSGQFFDTLSAAAPVLTVAGTAPSNTTFTYTAPSGANAPYTMKYTTYTVQTKFGCSEISDYGPTSNSLVSEIDLPDIAVNPNDKYTFTYEQTPGVPGNYTGRLASVTLPTGGTITYKYTGGSSGNITCADGSAPGLERYTPDTGSSYWNYARTPGTGAAYTTTVTDPAGNNSVIQFQGIYETERQLYQGSISSANLLQTITTCYNANTSNCTSTAITLPITQRNITTLLSGGLQSEHDDLWNTYGGPTETDDYDYGAPPHGPLLKKILATYATLGNIHAFRQSVITQNGSGNTVSQINYNYDETSPATTSGTPQHVSVPAPWGNLTSTNVYTSATNYLTTSSTYWDTGNLNTTTDVNGGLTTYNYASGLPSCYNSFATSITEAVSGLSKSATWNCTGGVQLTSVDENSQTTTTTYSDPYYWRPASVTDPTLAVTSYCYGSLSTSGACTLNPSQAESTLTFNSGNSTVDSLTTLDGLGRTILQQTRQAPGSSNFDTVETTYDSLGHARCVTLPYSSTAGQIGSPAPSTCTTYDAMSRPLTVIDGGNPTPGSTIYFYGNPGSQNNDVLITRSPAPSGDGENTKRRQFEYDALGRLTSVCEVTGVTTAWPGGNCAQNTATTGYWTKYSYDPMGNLLTLTQNAQATPALQQSRVFVYDWKSRVTSETVPEIGASGNGTATYSYDSDSTCGTYTGDLVKTVDAAGDTICSTYDKLHRKLTTTYPSGTYASVTPQKYFVYDAATVNGQTMAYPIARLAEAYTCFSPCSSKLTDIGLSYTVRGETSDVYESTPNSGAFYYHATQTYWANRGLNQLTGNLGLPTITYGPDGEGRINTVSASSGQNPVSGTTYNNAGLPTAINLGSGSGDADSYQYDPYTNRMKQYQFTVNGTSLTANLGWNANATLQSQNITDGFNSADTQNCSYVYDDITRLANANCGSAAAQTFSYDPFSNIDKSGSPYSFQPTYSPTTNRMTCFGGSGQNCTGGFVPTYDSNGNVTNDSFHAYTWDADGHPITVDAGQSDAVSLTYDALGRMVEQSRGSAYTQIAYSPVGQKLALMSLQTLQKAMVPLTGKSLALYNSSGILYYAHSDMLGSIRLGTTPARSMYFDTAYAPFGEPYASIGTLDLSYTGQTNDTSSYRQDTAGGLYDFPLREYSTQGRWPNPDPLGRSSTCPKDPQTQNRYAYVRNNPMTYTDPTGGVTIPDPPWGGGGGGGGCDFEDPICDLCDIAPWLCYPVGSGGAGGGFIAVGGGSGTPPPFPWPVMIAMLDLIIQNAEMQTLKLKKCTCTEEVDRNGAESTLYGLWTNSTTGCGASYYSTTGAGCLNDHVQLIRNTNGSVTMWTCAQSLQINNDCDPWSVVGPYFEIVDITIK